MMTRIMTWYRIKFHSDNDNSDYRDNSCNVCDDNKHTNETTNDDSNNTDKTISIDNDT